MRTIRLTFATTLIALALSAPALARNPTPQERTDIENLACLCRYHPPSHPAGGPRPLFLLA